jgi:hypothetical protein
MTKPQNILQSTVGFEVLMHLLSDILKQYPMTEFSVERFLPYIEKVKDINYANIETFPIATKGKGILYKVMYENIFS